MMFRYKERVLDALIRHGISPREDTPPELVRDFINDLYVYEIRLLRKQMRSGQIPKQEYAGCVIELRKRYPLLSLPIEYWTD